MVKPTSSPPPRAAKAPRTKASTKAKAPAEARPPAAAKPPPHPWAFRARFRKHAFGWRSQPAIQRIKEAVAEIKRVARTDKVTAAEGAVLLIERLSPALEKIDSSSGAIGSAVNRALDELVPIVAEAGVPVARRQAWLERLWQALLDDDIPYIEALEERWGDLCASADIASEWADRCLPMARDKLGPGKASIGGVLAVIVCLSALFRAGRHQEILSLLQEEKFWSFKRWEVLARAALGDVDGALACAEAARGPWTSAVDLAQLCEQILREAGRDQEAFERYAIEATYGGTYLSTFRALSKKYPGKKASELLDALVASTPGDEGKWFAAAKDAGLFDEALRLASLTPCDPKTLARAARDHALSHPTFALGAGMIALEWLAEGYGYEITDEQTRLARKGHSIYIERCDPPDFQRTSRSLPAALGAGRGSRATGAAEHLGRTALSPAGVDVRLGPWAWLGDDRRDRDRAGPGPVGQAASEVSWLTRQPRSCR